MAVTTSRATGQLPATPGVLFTAAGDCSVRVSLAAGGATDRTFSLYLNTGTRRRFARSTVPGNGMWPAGQQYGPVSMKSGDTIDGEAAVATEVEYVISVVNL